MYKNVQPLKQIKIHWIPCNFWQTFRNNLWRGLFAP